MPAKNMAALVIICFLFHVLSFHLTIVLSLGGEVTRNFRGDAIIPLCRSAAMMYRQPKQWHRFLQETFFISVILMQGPCKFPRKTLAALRKGEEIVSKHY